VVQYLDKGSVSFDKVLSISVHARIPNLTHVYGFEEIHKVLIVLLTSFNNSLNLIRPMNAEQIVECAFALVMTTEEDQLSVEDYVLFFKGAKEGKYGKILDRLDQQTIFEMLEQYRSERHRQFVRIKDERHQAQKAMGDTERTNQPDPLAEHMSSLGNKLSHLKERVKELNEMNRMKTFEKDL
jgi:hypothetical protein